ncbi:collagen alpha-3(IX) chain-like isoform X2 [Fukomys damarensis]|uniref:collagen alpha-3(IX) chain-like isoform X2 n=1 Tax=Fukomys damarensis TaxID=885580 RepID=UPI00053F4D67|nr:collagen alpha-3(IX) chain-like isoform X2 [Fukomys damarensis]
MPRLQGPPGCFLPSMRSGGRRSPREQRGHPGPPCCPLLATGPPLTHPGFGEFWPGSPSPGVLPACPPRSTGFAQDRSPPSPKLGPSLEQWRLGGGGDLGPGPGGTSHGWGRGEGGQPGSISSPPPSPQGCPEPCTAGAWQALQGPGSTLEQGGSLCVFLLSGDLVIRAWWPLGRDCSPEWAASSALHTLPCLSSGPGDSGETETDRGDPGLSSRPSRFPGLDGELAQSGFPSCSPLPWLDTASLLGCGVQAGAPC